jgi:hypothetical protein
MCFAMYSASLPTPGRTSDAPDHVRHIKVASVLERRATVYNAHGPRHLFDSGGEVLQLDADERRAMGDEPGSSLSPDRGPQCQGIDAAGRPMALWRSPVIKGRSLRECA